MRHFPTALLVLTAAVSTSRAEDFRYKPQLRAVLVEQVPGILASFDSKTGRFGSGIWICQDQERMYPLAVAYAQDGPGNRFHRDGKLLDVIIKAGDALIADMDALGQWEFRKKDGSTWGKIWMPWTYSRWIRTFTLIRDDMPPERRDAWTKALTLGYSGIAKSLGGVHNIPAHHAMGLYAAGKALDRPAWCQQAARFLAKVAAEQSAGGYWSEGGGPVVLYDFVYLDALGTYHAMSGDRDVLAVLEKGARFHWHFTYPDGRNVETVDQRNPYHDTVALGNAGFSFSPIGRAFLRRQWSARGLENLDADLIASMLLYGEEGPVADLGGEPSFVLVEKGIERAAVVRQGPWFVCLSAFTTPVVNSRWIQDRQNFASIYHDRAGLILGGGNTKLQPGWSSFTVGDCSLLSHRAGDANPDFRPRDKLFHVPSAARLATPGKGDSPHLPERPAGCFAQMGTVPFSLELTYGPETCRLRVLPKDDRTLEYCVEATEKSGLPVTAHLTLLAHLGKPLTSGAGEKVTLGPAAVSWTPQQLGGWIAHGRCRLDLPPCASVHWPALPHNPYRKDGAATPEEGRIEVRLPFESQQRQLRVLLTVLP